jgi:hypothetical protein
MRKPSKSLDNTNFTVSVLTHSSRLASAKFCTPSLRSLLPSTPITSRTCEARDKGKPAHEPTLKLFYETTLTRSCRTYIAFDAQDAAALVKAMKRVGINIGTCGKNTVRLRPMLIFEEAHGQLLHTIHVSRNSANNSQSLRWSLRSTRSLAVCK